MCSTKKPELGDKSMEYQEWWEVHRDLGECQANFDGSSGAMEPAAAEILWRSIDECNMRYTGMLSDGDAKTFSHVSKLQVYGPEVEIIKEECVNHVEKRLVEGLINVIKKSKDKGLNLGGKGSGKLTQVNIGKLANLYRKAIVDNPEDPGKMQSSILAILDHCSSTDSHPNHNKCPEEPDSWCSWKRAEALQNDPPPHSPLKIHLNPEAAKAAEPVFKRLSSLDLLQKGSKGGTQNTNECLHSVVWTNCPKERYISRRRLEVGVTRAVASFNMGNMQSLDMRRLSAGEDMPQVSKDIATRRDERRKRRSEEVRKDNTKRYRKKQAGKKAAEERRKRSSEGVTYRAGAF